VRCRRTPWDEADARLATRGLCALAAGDAKGATAFDRHARETWAGQPGVSPALERPLERLEARLRG
jgi:hypothetical protein